jgi:hypothetical protein
MKKLWIYLYYSPITRTFEAGKPIKEPYVWAVNAPDADYSEVTDNAVLMEKIKELYYKYEVDGLDYFRTIRAQLVLDYKQGTRSSSDIFGIETMLSKVIDRLVKGDWMSAQYEMSLVTVTPPLDQALYDEIMTFITNYISTNY